MAYRFVKVQQAAHLWGWYLAIPADDEEQQMEVHKAVACSVFLRMGTDPHLQDERNDGMYNPVRLASGWLMTIMQLTARGHDPIYVNPNGGMFAGRADIVEERILDDLHWPPSMEQMAATKITIKRWPQAQHYYLGSPTRLVFSKPKFDTLDEAMAEARLYALDENITVPDPEHLYLKQGD